MYISRKISDRILLGARQAPVIAIVGPRQSGKSTLAKQLFPQHAYIDLQDADAYEFANTDPKGFLMTHQNPHGIIIDEAQYAPKLFAQIKVESDRNAQPGYYVLSGSQNFLLHEKISESLAGRVYIYTLLPLSIHELVGAQLLASHPEEQIFTGFYPRVYQPHVQALEYYVNYISTYVERDIRSLRNIDNILAFKKFMNLCALRIGTTLNLTDVASHCGINVQTAKSWLGLLETSFIIFLLPSYSNNLGKRVIKTPKLYFYDVGLAAALMGITQEVIIEKRSIYGALFENMIIVDIIKNLHADGTRYYASFLRDSNQKEIDLILEVGGTVIPIEIKASASIQSSFFDTLTWFQQETGNQHSSVIIYGGNQRQTRSSGLCIPWNNTRLLTE